MKAQKIRTFDECVEALFKFLYPALYQKDRDRVRRYAIQCFRPLFDEQEGAMKVLATQLGLEKETTTEQADEIGRLRNVIIRFDRYSHGFEADAGALLNELDKAMKSFALAEKPGSEGK